MRLQPCPHCQRHVRATEETCPFCAGELERQTGSAVGALARAAVFAGAGLMAAGCSSTDKNTEQVDKRDKDTVEQTAAKDAGAVQTTPDASREIPVEKIRREDPKPYGAPPNRIRRA